MQRNVADILHDCRFFSAVEGESFRRLATIARLAKFPKDKLIFREGDPCPGMYIVDEGLVRVYKTGPQGKEHVLHMVGPGQTFAEVAAIGGFDCPANADAVAPTQCVLLPFEPFRKALQEDHELCLQMITSMTFWVRKLVGLLEDVVLRDAAGRLARYLLQADKDAAGWIELPTLKRHVASHLNLTSETFSRTLRRLIDGGLIAERDSSRLEIVDAERLAVVAQGMGPKI